jgi:hypothetical protein
MTNSHKIILALVHLALSRGPVTVLGEIAMSVIDGPRRSVIHHYTHGCITLQAKKMNTRDCLLFLRISRTIPVKLIKEKKKKEHRMLKVQRYLKSGTMLPKVLQGFETLETVKGRRLRGLPVSLSKVL